MMYLTVISMALNLFMHSEKVKVQAGSVLNKWKDNSLNVRGHWSEGNKTHIKNSSTRSTNTPRLFL